MAAAATEAANPPQTETELLEQYADLNLVGYPYNTCYGGFGFSRAFLDRLNESRAVAGLDHVEDDDVVRSDPTVIRLYREMGSEKSSGPFAEIALKWIPVEFLNDVDVKEYDGKEIIVVNFQRIEIRILNDFLREWRAAPDSVSVADLDRRIATFKQREYRYRDFQKAQRLVKMTD